MAIIEKEFALSGSEQNPDVTNRDLKLTLSRVLPGAAGPVEAFKKHGEDFVVASSLSELVDGMNALTDEPLIDLADLGQQIVARDREMDNPFTKDLQVSAIHNSRRSRGERVACTATGRWKAHSWAAACSPVVRRAGELRRSCGVEW